MTCIFDVTELSKEEADRFEQNGPGLASKTFGAIGTGIGAVGGAAKSGIGTVGGVAKSGITGVVGGTVSGIGSVGGKIGGAIGGVFKGGDSEMAEEMANLKKQIQDLDGQIEKNKKEIGDDTQLAERKA